MNCNDFIFPIISVSLLKNDTDIVYHVPANAEGHDYVNIDTLEENSTNYASIVNDGEVIIADNESFKLSNTTSPNVGGYLQKVTLEYSFSSSVGCSIESIKNQQVKLRQNYYSLLVEFFDGSYGIVRVLSKGDGYVFSSKEEQGTTTNTIIISNTTGIQYVNMVSE